MNQRTQVGSIVLVAALCLAILGDALLRSTPWGINIFLWISALGLVLVLLGRRWSNFSAPRQYELTTTALLGAAAFAWHDSPALGLLNALAILVAFGLVALPAHAKPLRLSGVMEYALEAASSGIYTLCGLPVLLFGDVEWKQVSHRTVSRRLITVGRGVLLALPLLFVFGGLLMAADAVFEGIVNRVLTEYFNNLFSHVFVIGFCTWISAGFLRGVFVGKELAIRDLTRPKALAVGGVEAVVVLTLLNLLFLSFVLVQFHYFFGGAAQIGSYTKLTYAEYARRGFFELVAVAALILPLLLVLEWLVQKDQHKLLLLFRGLIGLQVIFLFVIMASALQRMRLYQGEFGLTELRLYTTAFMGWLAAVLIWFMLTVLIGKRERFAFGALVAGFLLVGALHLLNPDDFVIRTNLARTAEGRSFDAKYASSLSADSVPALIGGLASLSPQERKLVATRILKRWSGPELRDWRSWNSSRYKARALTQEYQRILTEAANE
jgi:hypothetical protein